MSQASAIPPKDFRHFRNRTRREAAITTVMFLSLGYVRHMPVEMSLEKFEELVGWAIDEVPEALVAMIENCIVLVEPDPPAEAPGLLGLYVGIPLTERNSAYSMTLPDRICIYMNPTLEICNSYAEVIEQVRITVAHEIAHHFGISDARLHELGYG